MKSIVTLTGLAAIGGLLLWLVFGSFGYRDGQVHFQNDTQSAYNQNRTHLASYVREVETNTGLAQLHNKDLTTFIEAAVSGTKGKDSGSMVFALRQAFPNLPDTKIEMVMKEVEVQEAKFANDQNDLSERIKAWDNFRMSSSHLIYNLLPWCQFPTDDLTALGPDGSTLKGKAALDHMRELVSSGESDKAYGNNQFDGVKVPQQ